MAQSPFATSGNVADIEKVQLRGGFAPDTGIADAIVNVANLAIPLITKAHEDELIDDVSGKIKAVSLALKATRFPSIQDTVFSEEALANPQVALALSEFTLIQDATTNGRLPATFALERLELIQNNAIRNAPEFEAEIRGAMRDATGQDPQKTLFNQLLSGQSKGKTAQEKLDEQLFIEAGKNGITVERLVEINNSKLRATVEEQQYDLLAKKGTYELNVMSKDVANRGANIVTDVMAEVNKIIVAGGAIGVEEKRNLIAQVNTSFGIASKVVMERISGANVSGTAIQASLAPLNALRDNTIKMIEDNTMQTMLSQHNAVVIDSTVNNVLNNDQFGSIYALAGQRGLLDWMKWTEKAGKTAEGKALVGFLNEGAKIGFELANIGKQYSRIGGNGADPETRQEKQERVVASGIALSTVGGDEDFQMLALEDINKYGGVDLAWGVFKSDSVLRATKANGQLKSAFINMQVTTTAGLSTELLQLAANPDLPIERLTLTQSGTLMITKLDEGVVLGGTLPATRKAEGELQVFVDRFNRANTISAKADGFGILPAGRYKGAQQYWDVVRTAANEANVRQEKKRERKVIIDSSGNLVFDGGGA